ncbi:MAG: nicotinate phosphoribosyltransferase [Melioribacteraceae bacterium]
MKTIYPATLLCDFYKVSHREQYPIGTEKVYSTWTPRSNKYHPTTDKVVVFGIQAFVKKYLINYFNTHFFSRSKEEVLNEYTRVLKFALGIKEPHTQHIEDLHDLGYLPLLIKSLPEGTKVSIRVPMLTIENTNPRFFWLTNFVETILSTELWMASTSATTASEYRTILDSYAEETGDPEFVQFQAHDFSMRGMSCLESAASSGAGHLLSFVGTDTIPAIFHLEEYYNADIEKELVGCSVNATEHSVMCAGGDGENEFNTYKRLLTEVYPSGIVSIVSDTWNLWSCVENIIKPLKSEIMARDGKAVIRPDSGDPVKIICGDKFSSNPMIQKGLIECLWDIFGGVVNEKGYKVLDPHIGAIYGDSITLDRCTRICHGLKEKGFSSTNIVFGVGSYTYQYNTKDSFGFALKSTMCQINGEEKQIYKNPATDDGTKKSNTGCVAVIKEDGEFKCIDGLSFDHEIKCEMLSVFENGVLLVDDSLADIRKRIRE